MGDSLLNQLKQLVCQIDDKGSSSCPPCGPSPCCPAPCCSPPCCPPACGLPPPICPPPCPFPYPQVCMTCPPPCPAPTAPRYVKPLTLPIPPCSPGDRARDPETDYKTRYASFYNNYNVDYHSTEKGRGSKNHSSSQGHCNGVTVDGKSPYCEDYRKRKNDDCEQEGCPTGFKPCRMKLCGPPNCSPLGIWKATIQPCPPKPRKRVSSKYVPEECKRPCCKHWKPQGGLCLYDKPCKAHCFNHPPGMKPSHQ